MISILLHHTWKSNIFLYDLQIEGHFQPRNKRKQCM